MTTRQPVFLLTGANGQVGHALIKTLSSLGKVVATDVAGSPVADLQPLDLTETQAIAALVRAVKPTVIVNPAAYTAVDKAESEIALAEAVNVAAPRHLAEAARSVGAALIHFSTDYVFDGSGSQARAEDAPTAPLSVYGRTKLEGELAVAKATSDHVILRTSWVFSEHGHNFVKTMLRFGKEREEMRVVADQIGAPTSAGFLAAMTAKVIERGLRDGFGGIGGTYHLTCDGETSWHGFAAAIFQQAAARGVDIKVKKLEPIVTADYPTPAQRPKNSRLDCRKFERVFGVQRQPWTAALATVMAELVP